MLAGSRLKRQCLLKHSEAMRADAAPHWSASISFAPLAARTPPGAVSAFATPFQQALSCVVTGRFNVSGYRPADDPADANIDGGLPVPLGTGNRLALVVILLYRLRQTRPGGSWSVQIAAYPYGLLDDGSRDVVSYEWHPEGVSWVTWPHLHIGNSMLRDGAPLTSRLHRPPRTFRSKTSSG